MCRGRHARKWQVRAPLGILLLALLLLEEEECALTSEVLWAVENIRLASSAVSSASGSARVNVPPSQTIRWRSVDVTHTLPPRASSSVVQIPLYGSEVCTMTTAQPPSPIQCTSVVLLMPDKTKYCALYSHHSVQFQCTPRTRILWEFLQKSQFLASMYTFFNDHCLESAYFRSRPHGMLPQLDLWQLNGLVAKRAPKAASSIVLSMEPLQAHLRCLLQLYPCKTAHSNGVLIKAFPNIFQ